MVKITYVEHDGSRQDIDVPVGWSVMQAAVKHGVEGIEAECGGGCACATCHVFVDEAFLDKLPPAAANEEAMLENTAVERHSNSRLSCQIKVTEALDGMVVTMPERQS
jgi:2Fe-2S ferredoxin